MLRAIGAIVKKDLRLARRDPRFMGPSFIVPFVFMLVYAILIGSIGGGESFACGLVVEDQTQFGDEMASVIEDMKATTNHTWFNITRYDATEAAELLGNGQLVAYIIIPEGFGANISAGQKATVIMHINNINDDIVKNYVHRIEAAILLYNQGALSPDFNQSEARIALDETLNLEDTPSNTGYAASAAILLSVVVCTLAAQGLLTASEFETTAIYDAMISPNPRLTLVLGRTIAAIPRTLVVLMVTYPVISIAFGITPAGNPLVLFAILILTILGLVPLGEIIGIIARKREQALLAGVLLSVIFFFTSGGLAPVALMPGLFRYVTYLLPVTHGMTMWNRVFFFDTVSGLWFNSAFLIIFWIVGTIIAVRLTNKEVERS